MPETLKAQTSPATGVPASVATAVARRTAVALAEGALARVLSWKAAWKPRPAGLTIRIVSASAAAVKTRALLTGRVLIRLASAVAMSATLTVLFGTT